MYVCHLQPCLKNRWFQESHSAALRAPPSLACPRAAEEPSIDGSPLAARLLSSQGSSKLRRLVFFFTGMGTVSLFSFPSYGLSFLPEKGGLATQTGFFSCFPDPERVHSSVEGECASALRCSGARKLSSEPDPFLRDWHVKRMIDSFFSTLVREKLCPRSPGSGRVSSTRKHKRVRIRAGGAITF